MKSVKTHEIRICRNCKQSYCQRKFEKAIDDRLCPWCKDNNRK